MATTSKVLTGKLEPSSVLPGARGWLLSLEWLMNRQVAGCSCEPPICVPVADVVVLPSSDASMLMKVDRHFDCLLCGPFVERLTVVKNIALPVRSGSVLLHPLVVRRA